MFHILGAKLKVKLKIHLLIPILFSLGFKRRDFTGSEKMPRKFVRCYCFWWANVSEKLEEV